MKKSVTGQAHDQATLVTSLLRETAYPHPVTDLQVLDTHISWVILTGRFAYKIKKALRLEFLDFSTLELRRHFCEEELRLNRRWAPELYLDVVPIRGTFAHPTLIGDGEPIEYAVRMLQFSQESQLDRQLALGKLTNDDMHALAETISGYHGAANVVPPMDAEEVIRTVSGPMYDNFGPLARVGDDETVERIREWTARSLEELRDTLVARQHAGFVRECHGDLHLTNLVRLPSGIVPYDCVEFSVELRNMDVLSDLSFLFMDLVSRHRKDLAYALINRYLEKSGDYAGIRVMDLYFVYHCLIRAKVAAIRNTGKSLRELGYRLSIAIKWIERPAPVLVVMHGLSASGKTWLSSRLLPHWPAVRVRSDIERKRLHGLDEFEGSDSGVAGGIYTARATAGVYEHLLETAQILLQAGYSVILDASFLARKWRREAHKLATGQGAGFAILETRTARDELERRLRERAQHGTEASEADLDVLEYQERHVEPLDERERQQVISVTTDQGFNLDDIVKRLSVL